VVCGRFDLNFDWGLMVVENRYTLSDHYYKQKFTKMFIQLMIYIIFIIDHIHHLMNESKMLIFIIMTRGRGCIR